MKQKAESNRALMKMADGRWGEFAFTPAGGCCGFSSEGGRHAGASHYIGLTHKDNVPRPDFVFEEVSKSNQVLHLRDKSRGANLFVDLKTRNVTYKGDNDTNGFILWTISTAFNADELVTEIEQ